MSSRSLLQNREFNRLSVNRLNVQNLNANNINTELDGYTKDDELLVLITLNIQHSNIILDDNSNTGRIVFSEDNLKLVQWTDRTLNSEKTHRFNDKHTGEEAREILFFLWDKNAQGKRNCTDNPPNAQLTINCGDDVYITLLGINSTDNSIELIFELEENQDEEIENLRNSNTLNSRIKLTIDTMLRRTTSIAWAQPAPDAPVARQWGQYNFRSSPFQLNISPNPYGGGYVISILSNIQRWRDSASGAIDPLREVQINGIRIAPSGSFIPYWRERRGLGAFEYFLRADKVTEELNNILPNLIKEGGQVRVTYF